MSKKQRISSLPLSLSPRGLSRIQAAEYVGLSTTLFDDFISDGRMPEPRKANTRNLWDRYELDMAFDALPKKREDNPWDQIGG